jgi:hypothetical protein
MEPMTVRARYVLTPLLAAALLVTACRRSTDSPPDGDQFAGSRVVVDGLTLRAETAVLESFPVQLRTRVTASNETGQPISFTTGGCRVLLRAYRTARRTGAPAWDQERVAVCTMEIAEERIGPGQSREYTVGTNAAEILGDSLPNGQYFLVAAFLKDGQRVPLEAGEVDLAR